MWINSYSIWTKRFRDANRQTKRSNTFSLSSFTMEHILIDFNHFTIVAHLEIWMVSDKLPEGSTSELYYHLLRKSGLLEPMTFQRERDAQETRRNLNALAFLPSWSFQIPEHPSENCKNYFYPNLTYDLVRVKRANFGFSRVFLFSGRY